MLEYKSNESKTRSHFFISTKLESLYILSFVKVDEEDIYFSDDFLQENVVEMKIARVSEKREVFCKALSTTMKSIFDKILYKHDNIIIYFSVPFNSKKDKLVNKIITEDTNDEFHYFNIAIDGYSFYFFFNEHKTSSIKTLLTVSAYFKEEYDIDFKM